MQFTLVKVVAKFLNHHML